MYMQPTYKNSPLFSVRTGGQSLFTPTMRGYVGRVHYAQAVLSASNRATFVIQILDTNTISHPSEV